MSTELAIPEGKELASTVTDLAFQELASSNKFLPRLQLNGASSNLSKEGKAPVGVYLLINAQQITNLTNETRAYCVAMRLKAMDFKADPMVSYYDPTSEDFKKLKLRAETETEGPAAGPEFLMYIPTEKKFATFFMASPTLRREAPALRDLLRKAVTLRIHLVGKKFRWHAPIITPCSVELPTPDPEDLARVLHAFCNPPKSESASEEEKAATTRER